MVGSQDPVHNVQHDDGEKVLRSFKEWIVQEAQAGRDRRASLGRNDTVGESSYVPPSVASTGPSMNPNQRAIVEEISGNKPSVGRRVFWMFVSSLIVAAMVAVAWQAYRDVQTKEMISAWGRSSLTWLSTLSGNKSSVGPTTASVPKSSDQATAVAQSQPAPAGTNVSHELQQQLQIMMSDLAIVRRIVEQLASKQEQMAQEISTLQAAERNVSQKVTSLTQAAAVRAQRKNVPKIVHPEPAQQPTPVPLQMPPSAETPPTAH